MALTVPVPLKVTELPVGAVRLPGSVIAASSEITGVVVPVATST